MLLTFTEKGLYCAQGDFYIDPSQPVTKAVITHAHSDHARWGSQHYLCHHHTVPLLKLRLGDVVCQGVAWGEEVMINNVQVTLYPAGHVIGSSQVRIAYKGEICVISGDYKTEDDGISGQFEPIKCHTFITESTFALPIFQWKAQAIIYQEMRNWVYANQQQGKTSIFVAYSLGKAQRVIDALSTLQVPILAHGAIANTQEVLQQMGFNFPLVEKVTPEMPSNRLKKGIVIAPPSAIDTAWTKKFGPSAIGICSGWMQIRGNIKRKNADAGFALSDHADWNGLLTAIKATAAEKVYVTHGFTTVLVRYLNENGIEAKEL